ncbi:MAG: VWA domain-containing protein [Phycisphaeraceae bacterium]|nr:MAG: VWA domain-containing protein [Phycisphaeraceae bacterium]
MLLHASAILLPEFDKPLWLALIPPLWIASWWIARRSLSGWSFSRRTANLVIRMLVVAAVCAALAEPHARRRARDLAVVAVLDVSDSIPSEQRAATDRFLDASLADRPTRDRFGLVSAARHAFVQSLPSAAAPRADTGLLGPTDSSDLRRGLELARAVIPPDAAGRLLLITDGNETAGSLAAAATNLLTAGIPVDVAAVEYDRSGMVRLDDLQTPPWSRDGDTVAVRVVLSAGSRTTGRLSIFRNDEPVDLDPDTLAYSTRVTLNPGPQVLTLSLTLPPGPVHRFEAVFEPDQPAGSVSQLLRAQGVTFTSSKGRVLVLADDPRVAGVFAGAIASDNFDTQVKPAQDAPYTLTEWSAYDAVVLVNQPASNFSQAQQNDLTQYVKDAGGGLLVVGGPDGFGAGGWIGSTLADALPLLLDPPAKRELPAGALALIIDRSGSMSAPVGNTQLTQQQIANEAAILGVRSLSSQDHVAVIAFDDAAEAVVPLTRASDPAGIAQRIRAVGPRGGTNLFPAITAAADQLARSNAGVKHIIILTDGMTVGEPEQGVALVAGLKQRNITVSTVAVGDGANDPLLVSLAAVGGGRFYSVNSDQSRAVLPQIFIKEAQTVRRSLIWEGDAFSPAVDHPAESIRGIRTPLPAVTGYIVTADRGGLATTVLRGPEKDPILAQWQFGLGRVAAYTSDAAPRWNAAWINADAYATLWSQQLKWLLRPTGDPNARITIDQTDPDNARITLDLIDPETGPINFASVRARINPPRRADEPDQASPDLVLRQVAPGRYEGFAPTQAVGTHLLSVRYDAPLSETQTAQRRAGSVRAAIIRPPGEEFRRPVPNTQMLAEIARMTNGRVLSLSPSGANLWLRDGLTFPTTATPIWLPLALAAIAAFIIDIAARRLAFDLASARRRAASLWSRATHPAPASLASLAHAKARAQADLTRSAPAAAFNLDNLPPPNEATPIPAPAAAASRATVPQGRQAQTPTPQDTMARLRAAKKRSINPDDPAH